MGKRNFFRLETRKGERGEERFQAALKRTIRMALHLLVLIFFLFLSYQLYVYLLDDSFFRVKEIAVKGCRKVSEKTILALAGIEGMPNLFTVPLKEISERIEGHPWVEQVNVRKVFPDRISIQVEERRPIAILQMDEPYYIDSKGVIFSRVGDRDKFNFPFLTGLSQQGFDKDPVAARHLIAKALEMVGVADREKAPPLNEISEIHMEMAYGIQCFSQAKGVEVRMGWDHFEEKLRRLSLIWTDLQKRGVLAASIDCSDLRRMVVKNISRGAN